MLSWARCSSGPQELGEHWLPHGPAEGGLLPACVPGTFCSGVVRAPEAAGLLSRRARREEQGGQRGEGSPRGARATSYSEQAGERAAGRAARCGAVLHAGAERARARGHGAGLSAGAVLLAAPLQLAGPAPHSRRRSRGGCVPSRPRPRRQPAPATAAAAERRARAALRAASPPRAAGPARALPRSRGREGGSSERVPGACSAGFPWWLRESGVS